MGLNKTRSILKEKLFGGNPVNLTTEQIGEFFEYLWEQASEGLTAQEVQECFDMLGE